MPRRPPDEDLFSASTMTFGEHLEELRACLFKSLIGLIFGFVIGLFVGGYVVDFIQSPLTSALETYYEKEAGKRAKQKLDEMRDAGKALPADPNEISQFVSKSHLMPEEVRFDPRAVLQQLKAKYPQEFKGVTIPDPENLENLKEEDLIRTFLWHSTADDARVRVKSLGVSESFMIYIKASLLVGVLMASPYIFYQLWSFVGAGLYPNEKKYVHVFLPFSVALFLAGAALAFFFVFKPVLTFFFSFNSSLGIDIDPRISEWLGFVLLLPLGFGVSFQLPLVMLFLERIGIFTVPDYLSKFRLAILVIFVLSMVLTPGGDPYSMLLMALPLTLLYFGGVLLCKMMPRVSSPYDD
jgi:sec-independent protein translocase protein TatC